MGHSATLPAGVVRYNHPMIALSLALSLSVAQEAPPEPPEAVPVLAPVDLGPRLLAHNTWRRKTQIRSMSVLLGWSVANIGVGIGGWALADDPEWRAFHQMSVGFNAINVALAVPGLVGALRDDPARHDLLGTLRADHGTVGAFALNTGLDVGWVAVGAWMWERGERLGSPTLIGFGRSMVLQGGFLLLFDAVELALYGGRQRRFMLSPEVGGALGARVSVAL